MKPQGRSGEWDMFTNSFCIYVKFYNENLSARLICRKNERIKQERREEEKEALAGSERRSVSNKRIQKNQH